MADIQETRFNGPWPRRTADRGLVEASEAPPVKRLDGEVTRQGEIAFAGGTRCEVWVGQWRKFGFEKVSLSPTAFILLMCLFIGGLENILTGEGAQG